MNIEVNYQPSDAWRKFFSLLDSTVDQAVAVVTEDFQGYQDLILPWKSHFIETLSYIIDGPQSEVPFDINIQTLSQIRESASRETTWLSSPSITKFQADCYHALGLEVPGSRTQMDID